VGGYPRRRSASAWPGLSSPSQPPSYSPAVNEMSRRSAEEPTDPGTEAVALDVECSLEMAIPSRSEPRDRDWMNAVASQLFLMDSQLQSLRGPRSSALQNQANFWDTVGATRR
jgi:hypothetical protein